MSRHHPLVGLSMYGIMAVNALSHPVPVFTGEGYTPGLLTSLILFLPLCGWAAHVCFGPSKESAQ
ncbi:HXXEE domain-containing protein [Paenibacillus sp. D51F]